MKLPLLLGVLLLPLAAFGRETAYQALRAVGSQRDSALLKRVIEVRGRSGTPQPSQWLILLDDPLARGGVRELEVEGGKVISERTPINAYAGSAQPIDFTKLNLDSEGAFTLANEEAKRARVPFDSVDYALRRDDQRGAPAWHLQLLDARRQPVGSLVFAADNGAILASNFDANPRFRQSPPGGSAREPAPRHVSAPPADPPSPRRPTTAEDFDAPQESNEGGGVKGAIKDSGKAVGRTIDKTFHKVGASLEHFFTGKRTLDRRFREEE